MRRVYLIALASAIILSSGLGSIAYAFNKTRTERLTKLLNIFPPNIRASIDPSALKEEEITGDLDVSYVESLEDGEHSHNKLVYSIRPTGSDEEIVIYSDEDLRSSPAKNIKVKGLKLGNRLAVDSSNFKKIIQINSASDSNGTQGVLAIAVEDVLELPSTTRLSANEIRNKLFNDPLSAKNYFETVSYGNMTLDGVVLDTLKLHGLCNDFQVNLENLTYRPLAEKILNSLDLNVVKNFRKFIFVLPPNSQNTSNCFRDRIRGVGSLGKTTFRLRDGSTFNGTYSFLRADVLQRSARVAVHELGHNFNLRHASGRDCSSLVTSDNDADCSQEEYGNFYDAMGNNTMFHYNGIRKAYLRWLPESRIITLPKDFTEASFTISALELDNDLPALIEIPRKDGLFYYVEYRQELDAFDRSPSTFPLVLNGALINESSSSSRTNSRLIDTSPRSNIGKSDFRDSALRPNQTFVDPHNHVEITTVNAGPDTLTVRIKNDYNRLATNTVSLSGKVISNGENIEGAIVSLFYLNGRTHRVVSDSSGNYSFPSVIRKGEYVLRVEKRGFKTRRVAGTLETTSNFDVEIESRQPSTPSNPNPAPSTPKPAEPVNKVPAAIFTTKMNRTVVNFNNLSLDSDGEITQVLWSFGDGTSSTETSPRKVYRRSGTYIVQLTVTDDKGAENRSTEAITVSKRKTSFRVEEISNLNDDTANIQSLNLNNNSRTNIQLKIRGRKKGIHKVRLSTRSQALEIDRTRFKLKGKSTRVINLSIKSLDEITGLEKVYLENNGKLVIPIELRGSSGSSRIDLVLNKDDLT